MRKAKILLTLVMAAAVASTAAVSFAQWDKLTVAAGGTLTIAAPVAVETTDTAVTFTADPNRELGDTAPTYSGTVKFTIPTNAALENKDVKLSLDPVVKKDNTAIGADKFDIVIKDSKDNVVNANSAVAAQTGDAGNSYTVAVTPKDTTYADGSNLTVEVTATLSATAKS